jgi:uncharacterized membrane protein YccF (DUF307 family)
MTAQPADQTPGSPSSRPAKAPSPRTPSAAKATTKAKAPAATRTGASRSAAKKSSAVATTVLEPKSTEAATTAPAQALVPAQAAPVDAQLQPVAAPPVMASQQTHPPVPAHQVNVQVSAPAAPQVMIHVKQRGLFVRALYYVFIGWWLSGVLMFAAGVCIASVVLLPAGLALVNRLPQVMTLRPRSTVLNAAMLADGSMQYTVGSAEQRSMLVRTIYFCCVGWWAGMFVMLAAWLLSVLIVTMPLGLMLLNRVPAAVTLRRN